MKKWQLYSMACIINMAVTSGIIGFIFYENFVKPAYLNKVRVYVLLIFFVSYLIFIFSDYWGLKLIRKHRNNEWLSKTSSVTLQSTLVLQTILLLLTGYGTATIIIEVWKGHFYILRSNMRIFLMLDILFVLVFITGIIVFIGIINLIRSLRKNHLSFIDTIGSNVESD